MADEEGVSEKQRLLITGVLACVFVLIVLDMVQDNVAGSGWWHLLVEFCIAGAAGLGIAGLLYDRFKTKTVLVRERERSLTLAEDAARWRESAQKYASGLALAIESQLDRWELTPAEKEVAFLLIKGYSSREIAGIRKTAEKTVRIQSAAIYEKSGLAGRNELAAYFLEDLMLPAEQSGQRW